MSCTWIMRIFIYFYPKTLSTSSLSFPSLAVDGERLAEPQLGIPEEVLKVSACRASAFPLHEASIIVVSMSSIVERMIFLIASIKNL